MKTITVTAQRANNYGAVLQSYALQQVQESLGYQNELLYYLGTTPLFVACSTNSPKQLCKNIVVNWLSLVHIRKMKLLSRKYDEFRNAYLNETRRYYSIEELRADPPEADCYISGSDQVWNLNKERSPYRFLDFGNDTVRRYSYAASMSSYSLSDEEQKYFIERLQRFSGLSIREKSVCEYIQSFTGYKCHTNLDPVFLLGKGKWEKLAQEPKIQGRYILCYAVLGNPSLQKVIDKLKREMKLPVVILQSSSVKHARGDKYVFDAGPREFLGLIKNAFYIVTTSFHGTAFSVIFEKPFCTVIKSTMSDRMTDLLNLLKLSERVITDSARIPSINIDYSAAMEIVSSENESSLLYLKSMNLSDQNITEKKEI